MPDVTSGPMSEAVLVKQGWVNPQRWTGPVRSRTDEAEIEQPSAVDWTDVRDRTDDMARSQLSGGLYRRPLQVAEIPPLAEGDILIGGADGLRVNLVFRR